MQVSPMALPKNSRQALRSSNEKRLPPMMIRLGVVELNVQIIGKDFGLRRAGRSVRLIEEEFLDLDPAEKRVVGEGSGDLFCRRRPDFLVGASLPNQFM